MPIPGARFRVKRTPAGPVRLAFRGKGNVVEAKNLRTGATHSPAEFKSERAKRRSSRTVRSQNAKHRGQIKAMRRMSGANG